MSGSRRGILGEVRFGLASGIVASLGALLGCASAPDGPGPAPKVCEAPCEVFATFGGQIGDVAFDDQHVAVTLQSPDGAGEVAVVPISGGTPKTILRTKNQLLGVALLDGLVFVEEFEQSTDSTEFIGKVLSIPLDGGAARVLAKVKFGLFPGILAAGHWVFVAGQDDVTILSIDGTKPPTIDPGSVAVPIALDAENLYSFVPGFLGQDGAVFMSPRNGDPGRRLIRTNQINGVAVDATDAYVMEGGLDPMHQVDGALVRVPLAGGPPVTLLAMDNLPKSEENVGGLGLDAQFVYFSLEGTVFAIPKSGGARRAFADVNTSLVAEDRTHIYMVGGDDQGLLLRQKKLSP